MEIASQNKLLTDMPMVSRNSDILMALAVVGILAFMIIPLPPVMLDVLLSFNITFSIIVLLVSMYILKPLELSSFPSIVLIATLFRLSLNVASTRLILLHGNEGTTAAGKVIKAFGSFVVGGNYVVGAIVFLILVIINFVVITKGAGRIAEVAARFVLDAMPGKQMSIDADLNAGLIDDREAKQRRVLIAKEADFYGAMDGASKFVRGDAIAGVIITLINILAGFGIGLFQFDMSFADAAENYTLMTVGDGLVSQIPALILSTAAGIIVSRAGSETSLGKQIASQLLVQPRAIAIASVVLFTFGLVPGLPTLPFFLLAVMGGVLAYFAYQSQVEETEAETGAEALPETDARPEGLQALPPLDLLAVEIGYGLIPMVDVESGGELLERIRSYRTQIAQEIGVMIPSVHIKDNIQLKPGEYTILLKGNEVSRGELMVKHLLAIDPGNVSRKIDGIQTKDPTYGLPAIWVKESEKEKAMASGYTVVDLPTVLLTHLSDIIKRYSYEILGRQEVQSLIDALKESHPKVVEELIPNLLPLGAVVKVLQNLLREQIPVRDLLTILETLADWAPMTRDIDLLTEKVRQALARTITRLYQAPDGSIPLITLDPRIEKKLSESIQQTEQGSFMAIEPDQAQTILNSVSEQLQKMTNLNYQPVVLCSAPVRVHFRKLTEQFLPNLVVISHNDLLPSVNIHSLGTVGVGNAH